MNKTINLYNQSTNYNKTKEDSSFNYHTLVCFSSSRPSYNSLYRWFNNIIGSALFTEDEIDLFLSNNENIHTICNRLRILNVRKIILIVIDPNKDSNSLDKIKINSDLDIDFIMITMSDKTFYSHENIRSFIEKDVSTENIFFFFKNTSWASIAAKLRFHRIILSGGDKSHRHALSSVQDKLSKFLTILYGMTYKQTVKSYQIVKSNWDTKPSIDHTSKEAGIAYKKLKSLNKKSMETSNKRNFHSSTQQYDKKITTNNKITIETSTYLEFLNNTINNSNLTSNEIQQQIEKQWINNEIKRLQDPINVKNLYPNKFHSKILEAWETSKLIYAKKMNRQKFPTLWKDLNRLEYLFLTLSFSFIYYDKLSWTAIAGIIGKAVLYEVYIDRFKSQLQNQNKISEIDTSYPEFIESLKLGNSGYVLVGDYFLELLSRYPHDIFNSSFKDYDQRILILNENLIEDIKKNIIINPSSLPMICPPLSWSNNSFGGFLSNVNQQTSIITGKSGFKHSMKNREPLYNAVNTLNQIPFTINTLLLDYLENEGSYLLENINSKDQVQMLITLKLAKIYSSRSFYLSTKSDWRGRLYTESFFITYQGNDLSSSLLNFLEGESLTDQGIEYLYIYGANNHNEKSISKDSFNARIQWVRNNYDKIINLDRDLILTAENKFVFTAFCLNMRELDRDPNYIIKTPVFLDATCSGIQHLAALLRDLELGANVNLIPSLKENKPNDIYSLLVEPINNAINQYGEENPGFEHFSLLKFNRKILKTPIMTKVYNVSTYGIANQLKTNLKEEKIEDQIANQIENSLKKSYKVYYSAPGIDNEVILNHVDIYKIANIINDQIFVVFPSLNNIYSYFLNMAKIMVKLNIPITWLTPNGIEITQHYLKSKENKIAIRMFGKTKKIVMKEFTNILDSKKQEQAIIPNIIHSLDANHLINIINSAREENFSPIITIHDCFGTLPNRMVHLDYRVRKEFVLLYSQDNFLSLFHKTLINSIKYNNIKLDPENEEDIYKITKVFIKDKWVNIPKVPQLGKLDLENIMNSRYIIS